MIHMEFDPQAFGERLRNELAASGIRDVKDLQQRLSAKTSARGTSYGSVWSYINGQAPAEPRREVVEALGALFGVLPDYLMRGGPRTAAEQRARKTVHEASKAAATSGGSPSPHERREQIALELKFAVLDGLGITMQPQDIPDHASDAEMTQEQKVAAMDAWASAFNRQHVPHWVAPLAEVRRRLDPRKKVLIGKKGVEAERVAQDELANRIGRALRGPLEAFGIDPRDGVTSIHGTDDWMDDYITAMVPVLLAIAPRMAAATMRRAWQAIFPPEDPEPEGED